jgi:hypothetical protein
MKFQIIWASPSEDKPSILERVKITKELISQLEAEHNDKIISIKPIH